VLAGAYFNFSSQREEAKLFQEIPPEEREKKEQLTEKSCSRQTALSWQ